MIKWKYLFWSVLGMGFIFDIFQEGLMSIGVILGWLVGLMTMTEWEIARRKSKPKRKGGKND